MVEAGLGKTEIVIERILDQLANNPHQKIAYYVPTLKLAGDVEGRVLDRIDQQKNNTDLSFKERMKYSSVSVQSIKGRTHYCKHPLQGKINELRSKEQLTEDEVEMQRALQGFYIGGAICQNCKLNHCCEYVKQFDAWPNFRIYSSDHLLGTTSMFEYGFLDDGIEVYRLNEESDERVWAADFVVIDEDIVSKMTNTEIEEVDAFAPDTPEVIRDIFVEQDNNDGDLMAAISKYADDVVAAKRKQDRELKNWLKEGCIPVTGTESINGMLGKIRKNRNSAPAHYMLLDRFCEMYSTYKTIEGGVFDAVPMTVVDEGIWVNNSCFLCGETKSINSRLESVPILYLDASADASVVQRLLGRDSMRFHHVRVEYQQNVTVKQVYNNAVSRTWMKNPENQKKVEQYVGESAVISFKSFVERRNREDWGCFGNVRGLNKWNGSSRLIVVGREKYAPAVLVALCRKIHCGATIVNKDEYEPIHTRQIVVNKVVRMRAGNHQGWKQYEYEDQRMQCVSEHFEKAETYQAIHRLRLIHPSDHKKEVIFLSNEIVDVTVDELIDVRSLLKHRPVFDERMARLANAVKERGVVRATNRALSEITGMPANKISEMKRSDDFADVLRAMGVESRSYQGRNRYRKRVGLRVLMSLDCGEDMVVKYLESEGIKIETAEVPVLEAA